MTLAEFNIITISEQAEYRWNYLSLDERADHEHPILLHSLPGFYAEVFYHREDNPMVQFKAFTGIRQHTAYLKQ